MKKTLFRILALVALVAGFSMGNAAYAGHDGDSKFTGVIETVPNTAGFVGDWKVSGRTVHVTSSTQIEQSDGQVAVGATVKVEGTTRSDNSVDASQIEVKHDSSSGDGGGDGGSGGSGSGDDGSAQPEFKGTIEMLPATAGFIGDWQVGGRTIHVSSSTRLESEIGPIAVGAFAEIEGTVRADGSMDAAKIEIKSNVAGADGRDELSGTIESLPGTTGFVGDWKVSGHTIHVTATTVIDQEHGAPAVGAMVEVKGTMRADGSLDATKIEVKGASGGSDGSSTEGQSTSLKGAIQSVASSPDLVGEWTIADHVVHVTSSTRLNAEHGAFTAGARVKVKGLMLADGSIVATRIQVRD